MGIYNYTVLKSNPVITEIKGEPVKIHRIKFQGSDGSLDRFREYNKPLPGMSRHMDYWIDYFQAKAERAWKGEKPRFIVTTRCDGKFDWDSEETNYYYPDGFPVFECDYICYQEYVPTKYFIGYLNKVGKKLVFTPKEFAPIGRQV